MSFNFGNKKDMIIIISIVLIVILSSSAYYIDNWANFSLGLDADSSQLTIDIGLEKIYTCNDSIKMCLPLSRYDSMLSSGSDGNNENNGIMDKPNETNTININSKNSLLYMKISQTFFIIAIILHLYDPIKYKIYITTLFILAGIFSLLVIVCANKIANTLHSAKNSESSIKDPNPKLQVSSYLLIISSILTIGIGAIININ
jgi:hypothetical protein